jgi:cysteine desulfurase/selenocysteine lyase
MTTPPSTSNGSSGAGWLPDEATMNRLAGEFFAALPGGAFAPGGVDPVGLPALDVPLAAPPGPQPMGPPPTSAVAGNGASAAGLGLPFMPETAPGFSGGYLPVVGDVPVLPSAPDPSAGPYYFLPSAPTSTPQGGVTPTVPEPGFELLSPAAPSAPPATRDSPSGHYFLDERVPFAGGPVTDDRLTEPPALPLDPHPAFDVHAIRRDFPILGEVVHGKRLIWFDNAATTQKPQAVIDRLSHFYAHENSNIHRAAHTLAARATDAFESARDTVARFLGASSAEEIVFVRGATEGLNLIAKAWGGRHVREGDEIVISHLEHHANIVPWQMLAKETGAVIKVIPVDDSGQLLMDDYAGLLSNRTKVVAVTQVSNALGTVTPVEAIAQLAHRAGAIVVVDGAQSVPHTPVDVTAMGADFFVFSGHKIFGPTGIGVVYGRDEVLADTPPWQGGGNMITDVTLERSLYQPPPGRFEAGTGSIADAVGLATALDYVERLGMANIAAYEHTLVEYLTEGLRPIPGLRLVGTAAEKASVVSFVLAGYSTDEVGSELNSHGIAVRTGHHCAQPVLRRLGLESTVRPSMALYNTHDEIDTMVDVVRTLASRSGLNG